jgi:3-isopropylmalate/(R)-2-methylmalate dehydratase small subunit
MQPFQILTGVAAPLVRDDVNTDQVTPTSFLLSLKPDLARALFGNWRYRPDGSADPEFVLERPQFRKSQILVVGNNFGCGSSREQAAWAMLAFGIRCIVGRSFADFFRSNCLKNGILPIVLAPADMDGFISEVIKIDGAVPFTVDLVAQRIRCPGGSEIGFEIGPKEREALLEGLDDIGFTMKHANDIGSWETKAKRSRPWLQEMIERPSKGG